MELGILLLPTTPSLGAMRDSTFSFNLQLSFPLLFGCFLELSFGLSCGSISKLLNQVSSTFLPRASV